ncbi:MAG: sulfotransferase domain-containing protein [Candidatus Bathyarchaeota archaeon]|nr:MAG: sulfotransferase domain-containing protein [Candidatus Bathyarchaeota archaeon]
MRKLSNEFGFFYKHFDAFVCDFEEAVLQNNKKSVLSLNNKSDICFENFPDYKGSHFIRDPRDLVVSGYRYHLWTKEKWCNDPNFDWWTSVTDHPYFSEYVEKKRKKYPENISYKEYLNKLDTERGLILELIFCHPMLSEMKRWDYNNSKIIELKYEEIIGNETECFRRIFSHYEFHPKLIQRGVEIADQLSLKNQPKSETGHVRKGTSKQWASEFTPLIKDLFNKVNGDLLIQLGYEKDMKW